MNNVMIKSALVGALMVASSAAYATPMPTPFATFESIKAQKDVRFINKDVVTVTRVGKKRVITITPHSELISVTKGGKVLSTPIVKFDALINGNSSSGISAGDILNAYLWLDANSSMAAQNNGPGNPYTQLFDGSFKFIDVVSGKLLVEGDFTGAVLSANGGAHFFDFNGSSMTPATLTYSSQVFNLGSINEFAFSVIGTGSSIKYQAGHSLNYGGGFAGTASGTLSSVVPEPAALALFGFGLAGLGFARSRRA